MIRLAVIGADKALCAALAARLRGVTLDDAPLPQSLEACQGVVFFDPPFDEVKRCLQAGKPVLVVSASSLTRGTLQTLSEVHLQATILRRANVLLAIANADRYLPSRQLIRRQLHADKSGEIVWRESLHAGPLGAPGLIRIHRWESNANEASLLRDLDLIAWYCRETPHLVYALAHACGTQIHLGFPSGCMALIDQASMPADETYYSLSVIGAHGAAYLDDHQNMQIVYRGGPPQAIRAEEGVGQWVSLMQEFVDDIAGKRRMELPHWQFAFAIAEAVETSLKTRQAVPLEVNL